MQRRVLARGENNVIANGESDVLIAGTITVVLSGVLLALAMTALAARALFVACVSGALVGAVAGLVLLANGAVLPAIGLIVLGVALFPAWLLGGMLLSTNAAKDSRRRAPWLTLLAALATTAVIVTVTPDVAATRSVSFPEPAGLPALLAAIMFVAGVSVIGLIGFGERGALERRERNAP